MYTGVRISREQFLNSHFLKVTVTQLQKNYLHHNRFVIEVITDRNKQTVKKKFTEIHRFSEELNQKLALKDLAIESHMRNSKKLQQVELLFKKLNTAYLAVSNDPQAQAVRSEVRKYLYNLLFSNIEQLASSEEEEQSKTNATTVTLSSPLKEKGEKMEEKSQKAEVKEWRQSKEGTKLPNVIRNIFKPKRQSQDFRRRELLKGIKSIWLREKKSWEQRLFSITDESLILIQRAQPQNKHIIFLKYLQVAFRQKDYYRIVLTHPVLSPQIQIRINSMQALAIDNREEYMNLLAALQQSCDKGQRMAFNFIGVYICNKKNKFMVEPEKRPALRLNVRLSHEEQSYCFTMGIDSDVFVQLPILSNYGKYDAEVVEQKEGGIIPTLTSEKSTSFSLPVQSIYDQLENDRPKRKTPEMRSHLLQSKQCNYSIRLQYYRLSSWRAYCSGEIQDRFQGVPHPSQFSRGEFRIQRNRFKRILYSVEEWVSYLAALKNFEYPLRSAIFYLFLTIVVINFDANNIIQYCLAGTCLLLAYLHPASSVYLRDSILLLISNEWIRKIQSGLQERRWRQSFRVALKKSEEKRKFLQDFNMRKKKKRNILEKYNRLQQVLLRGQLALTEIVTLCEKVKNLFSWYHHRKTQWLFLLLLASFAACFFLPLRAITLLALTATAINGWHHHSRVCMRNQFVVMALLRLVVQEEGLSSLRENFEDVNRPFDKRTSEYATFQKKAKQALAEILQLQFDQAIFLQGKNMGQIVLWLSQCRDPLVIPEYTCRKHNFNLEWSRRGGKLTSFFTAVYLLLLSVPSDRNILEVRQEPEQQEDSEEDDLP